MAAVLAGKVRLFAAGSDKVRVGLIGCGGRGTGAAKDCVNSSDNVEITAMGDLFQDHLDKSLAELSREVDDKVSVTKETSFAGFDAFEKVIASDVDMVIFMEKPVAVDPVGVHSVIASSEAAEKKGLSIVAGTQRQHQEHYLEIMKRIHRGDIGEIVGGQCYWNMGELWVKRRQLDWSDMEWQCRNWLYFTWLSGDHIVEQHLHNLDVINWAIGAHPVQCMGMGGRQVRIGSEYGNIFDHFAVEYEYPNGVRVLSMCRQTAGCNEQVSERVVGTKGQTYTDGSIGFIEGQNAYKYEGESPNPYVQEHADLITSIREGEVLNEGKRVAESTMTVIMGRMSAYTGRALKWDWAMNASELDLRPPKYEFGDLPVRPVAVPGKTPLI
jgi:predicted dehydrogenase